MPTHLLCASVWLSLSVLTDMRKQKKDETLSLEQCERFAMEALEVLGGIFDDRTCSSPPHLPVHSFGTTADSMCSFSRGAQRSSVPSPMLPSPTSPTCSSISQKCHRLSARGRCAISTISSWIRAVPFSLSLPRFSLSPIRLRAEWFMQSSRNQMKASSWM